MLLRSIRAVRICSVIEFTSLADRVSEFPNCRDADLAEMDRGFRPAPYRLKCRTGLWLVVARSAPSQCPAIRMPRRAPYVAANQFFQLTTTKIACISLMNSHTPILDGVDESSMHVRSASLFTQSNVDVIPPPCSSQNSIHAFEMRSNENHIHVTDATSFPHETSGRSQHVGIRLSE